MTAVFVHGNPETDAVWAPLLAALDRDDVVCLSPPGFGARLTAGFDATVLGYCGWLIAELEQFDEPVDLVGHDWGGNHVVNVAMQRPDLLDSWVSDTLGLFDQDYQWHALAQQWQTPGTGEEVVRAQFGGEYHDRLAGLVGLGVPPAVADDMAAGMTPEMGQAVLSLYRSAAQPTMAALGRQLHRAAARPGLAITASDDHNLGTPEQLSRTAATAGATVAVLDGRGHWWMAEDPGRGAEVLTRFWASLGGPRQRRPDSGGT